MNPGGLLSWTIGSAIGVYLIADGEPAGVTWALPTTFTVCGGLYALALAAARPGWFVTHRPHDPRLEVADAWQQRILCESCDRSYVAVEMDRRPEGRRRRRERSLPDRRLAIAPASDPPCLPSRNPGRPQ
jgi:hypothetical protein